MALDLAHWHGNDLSVSATGDLLAVGDLVKGQMRLVRRLLTNLGDMWFHNDYGAGLPLYIGEPLDIDTIEAVIRYQVAIEAQVANDPQAEITLTPIFGGIQVVIRYVDADSGNPVTLGFDITE